MEPIRSTQLSDSAEHYEPHTLLSVSECSPEDSHFYTESDSEIDPSQRRVSRRGSHPHTHSLEGTSGSIELREGGVRVPASRQIYEESVEFWKSKEREWFAFPIPSGRKARPPAYLENLITTRTLLTIWSDMEHDFPDYKALSDRHMFLHALRAFFQHNSGFDRQDLHSVLTTLKNDQELSYARELESSRTYLAMLPGCSPKVESDTDNQYRLRMVDKQLRQFAWPTPGAQNLFITDRVGRSFASGMVALNSVDALALSSLQYSNVKFIAMDDQFAREVQKWLSNEIVESSRKALEDLNSLISAQESADEVSLHLGMDLDGLPNEDRA